MAAKCAFRTIKKRGLWTCLRDPRAAIDEFRLRLIWAPVMV
jgi:hypothetical protein